MPAVLSEPEIHYFSDISYRHPYHFSEGGPLPAPTTRPLYHLEAAADYMAATADMNQVRLKTTHRQTGDSTGRP